MNCLSTGCQQKGRLYGHFGDTPLCYCAIHAPVGYFFLNGMQRQYYEQKSFSGRDYTNKEKAKEIMEEMINDFTKKYGHTKPFRPTKCRRVRTNFGVSIYKHDGSD